MPNIQRYSHASSYYEENVSIRMSIYRDIFTHNEYYRRLQIVKSRIQIDAETNGTTTRLEDESDRDSSPLHVS